MKPPPFRYVRATSLEHALGTLATHAGSAKVLAGGQSLMPMLNFRLLEPDVVVDINGIPDLTGISETAGHLRIGALTRHREIETSPLIARHFPILAAAIRHVAHMTIRNRGTFAGSLAHADPAAELPMMAMLLRCAHPYRRTKRRARDRLQGLLRGGADHGLARRRDHHRRRAAAAAPAVRLGFRGSRAPGR